MFNYETVILYDPKQFVHSDTGDLETDIVEQKILMRDLLKHSLYSKQNDEGQSSAPVQMVNNCYRLANDLQDELAHFLNLVDKLDKHNREQDMQEIEMRTKAMFEKYGNNKAYPYERVTELSLENTKLREELAKQTKLIDCIKGYLDMSPDADEYRVAQTVGWIVGQLEAYKQC